MCAEQQKRVFRISYSQNEVQTKNKPGVIFFAMQSHK